MSKTLTENPNIVIIGSSAGGPRILKSLFTGMPFLNGCLLVVQHMPKFVNESLCGMLDGCTDMTVRLAEDGDKLERGHVYLAPSEIHLELENNRTIRLHKGEKVNFVCPSVDITMKSAKKTPGALLIGIILTGMGKDGAKGIRYLKEIEGITRIQASFLVCPEKRPKQEPSILYSLPMRSEKSLLNCWAS
jgi:two-component system chemotaxis response regulator CheB